ncbi:MULTISPECIES: hypothetical protein [unclassified Cupriavidus]|uniref:hypothetical protein n=1 Tax=unclassified Cupriavidus TaxID=2640874 RepID=UPI0010F45697|nr:MULTISPECIES: hypothetical protein [unclassified Cupriavidus]MWL87439.1 hypothetical protein [Cupriavidus sp. SW-Y-13]
MVDPIYQKTEAGQEEIRTRARKLDQKLRALLLIVNGERSRSALLAQVSGMGVSDAALDTLLSQGLIVPIPEPVNAAPPPRAGKPEPARTRPETNLFAAYSGFNSADGKGIDDRFDVLADTTIAPAMTPAPPAPVALAGADNYQRLYHFFTDVIGNHLGLRGYVMQVKVEKASTIVELAALRDVLGTALQKAKGDITAHAIIDQLDDLLAEMGVAPAR